MIQRLTSHNVVAQRELTYRERRGYSVKWRFVYNALSATVVLLATVLFGSVFMSLVISEIILPKNVIVDTFVISFIVLTTLLHFGLMVRTLALAADAIGREKRETERWDVLILTGISARDIILGKWWIVIYIMWREYLLLAILRVAVVAVYSAPFTYYLGFDINVPSLLWGSTVVFILTLLNLPFTAACGIVASIATQRGGGLARAFITRIAFGLIPGVLPASLFMLSGGRFSGNGYGFDHNVSEFYSLLLKTAADNGVTVANALFHMQHYGGFQLHYLLVFVVAVLFYSGLTWVLLQLAQRYAVRESALKAVEVEPDLLQTLETNPITRIEIGIHERRKRLAGGRTLLGQVTLGVMLFMSMLLYWGEFAAALTGRDATPIGERFALITYGFVVLTFLFHFRVMLRTLSIASSSVSRDKQSTQHWEALALTGIDARSLIMGKWWATIRLVWFDYVLLALLRMGAILWHNGQTGRDYAAYLGQMQFYYGSYPMTIDIPTAGDILLAGVFVAALTMANLPYTAAAGIVATMDKRRSAEIIRAFFARAAFLALVIAITLGLTFLSFYVLRSSISGVFSNTLLTVLASMFDNGYIAAGYLSRIRVTSYGTPMGDPELLIGVLLSITVYIGLAWGLLRLAEWKAFRQGILSQSEVSPEKQPVHAAKT